MPRSRSLPPAIRLLPALIALLACLPSGAAAQEGAPVETLSLDDAVRLARQNNPGFGIQASSLETLGWRRRNSWGSFVPQASFSNFFGYTADGARQFGDFTLGTRPAQLASVYNLGLSLSLTGAAFLEHRVVSAQEVATRAQVDGAAAALVDEVTRAYLAVLQADEELDQALVEVERTEAYVGEAEAQVAVGAATPLDIRRAETQEGQALIQLVQAENAVATTRLALGQILGTEVSPVAALTTDFPIFEPGLDGTELIALALAGNPVLRATRSEAAAARTQTGMARSQYFPSVSLSASWTGSVFQADGIDPLVTNALAQVSGRYQGCLQDNRISALLGDPARDCGPLDVSNPAVAATVRSDIQRANSGFPFSYERQPVSLSASVSIPLFTGFSRQLQIEEARVAAANAGRQVEAEELRLRAEVGTALRAVETAFRIAELQAGIRENSAEELRLAQERFRLGLASSIEVVDAQANLSQAERDEISAVYEFHISFSTLESLVGAPLRE